jgi:integrase
MGLRMANPSTRKGTKFPQFRLSTPADIRRAKAELAKLGINVTAEVTASLRTGDEREAKARFARLTAEWQERWQSWRDVLRDGPRILTQKEIFAITSELVRDLRRKAEDFPGDPEWWRLMVKLQAVFRDKPDAFELAEDVLVDYRRGLQHHLARRYGWHAIDPKSLEALLQQYLEDLPRAMDTRAQMASGDYRVPDWLEGRPAGGAALIEARGAKQPALSFKRIIDHWTALRGPAPASVRSYKTRVRSLTDFLGYDDAARLTDEDVRRWRDAMIQKKERTAETIRDHLAAVTALLGHAVENKMLPANPAANVKFRKRLDDGSQKKRRSFTNEEARRILEAARKEKGLRRWGPWIAAHTAMRIGEVAQLRKADVVAGKDGALAIRVNPHESRVKGHRERTVPVHSALIAEGFPAFVAACSTERLFPECYGGKHRQANPEKVKNYASQLVAAWVRGPKVGITDLSISPSHSWRHYFNTLSREHEMERDVRKAIVGHLNDATSQHYGETTDKAKRMQMEKLPSIIPPPPDETGSSGP